MHLVDASFARSVVGAEPPCRNGGRRQLVGSDGAGWAGRPITCTPGCYGLWRSGDRVVGRHCAEIRRSHVWILRCRHVAPGAISMSAFLQVATPVATDAERPRLVAADQVGTS